MRSSLLRLSAAAFLLLGSSLTAHAEEGDTLVLKHDPERYRIVVSATRTHRNLADVPGSAQVLSGAELRRTGARTLSDALINVTGLDTGDGSDNGSRFPNIGMWGLKEFDALLITVDGVPVGGPFNPSLSQIAIDDIERIEILKGPQGTLYGVSAFAGAINIVTRGAAGGMNTVRVGTGELGQLDAHASVGGTMDDGTMVRGTMTTSRGNGWQDAAGSSLDRGSLALSRAFGERHLALELSGFRDDQRWGTPMPYDAGAPLPGFVLDRNYAVRGAHIEHRVFSGTLHGTSPAPLGSALEATVGFARDQQTFLRSFFMDFPDPDTVGSEALQLHPTETTFYADLQATTPFEAGGQHELVTGAALTFGSTRGDAQGFDFDQALSSYPGASSFEPDATEEMRDFEDERTFFGVYAHDEWTPISRFSLSGGGRWDATSENLEVGGDEGGTGEVDAKDSRSTQAFSGDLGALVRLAPPGSRAISSLNLFGNWKSAFKPAAPNLTEAESAEILDPERTHSIEGGLRASMFDEQFGLEASMFQMDFHNLVVANLGPGGAVQLINAGHERFKGYELGVSLSPASAPGLTLRWGYAHHDARFVEFTFVTPDSQLRDVGGKRLELVPTDLWNASASYRAPCGAGLWGAVREQGERPLTRRNTFFTPSFTEWDAGASYERGPVRVAVAGRNLGDDRHPVGESEIGDSQFYISAPRRVVGEVTFRF